MRIPVQQFDYKKFYKKFDSATDHWNQSDHRPRLEETARLVEANLEGIKSIGDFGCGNGGLLKHLSLRHPEIKMWGYDLQEPNVNYARNVHGLDVSLADILEDDVKIPDLLIVTETLEHLPDPQAFLRSISKKVKVVIGSVPGYENQGLYDPGHFWVFTDDSFKEIFDAYEIADYHVHERFQFVVAKTNYSK